MHKTHAAFATSALLLLSSCGADVEDLEELSGVSPGSEEDALSSATGDLVWEKSAEALVGKNGLLYGRTFGDDDTPDSSFGRMSGKSGKLLWSRPVDQYQTTTDEACLYADVLVITENTTAIGLDANTGDELWSHEWEAEQPIQPFCPDEGEWFYVTTGRTANEVWIPKIVSIRRQDGHIEWEREILPAGPGTYPTLEFIGANAHSVFLRRDRGEGPQLQARSAGEGELQWTRSLSPEAYAQLDAKGRLLISRINTESTEIAIRRISTDTGDVLWRREFTVPNPGFTSENGTLLVLSDKWVRRLKASDGSDVWKRQATGYGLDPTIFSDGRVVLTSTSSDDTTCTLTLMDSTNNPEWQRSFSAPCDTNVDDNDRLYIRNDNTIRRLRTDTGEVRWRYTDENLGPRSGLSSRVASDDEAFYSSWLSGTRHPAAGPYALDIHTGALLWRSDSALGNGIYFVKSTDNRVILGVQHYRSHPTSAGYAK